jgi:hypothetical protein
MVQVQAAAVSVQAQAVSVQARAQAAAVSAQAAAVLAQAAAVSAQAPVQAPVQVRVRAAAVLAQAPVQAPVQVRAPSASCANDVRHLPLHHPLRRVRRQHRRMRATLPNQVLPLQRLRIYDAIPATTSCSCLRSSALASRCLS